MPIAPPASAPPDACRKWRRLAAPTTDDSATSMPRSIAESVLPAAMLHEDETILLLIKPSPLFILLTSLRFVLGILLTAILAVRLLPSFRESIPITSNHIAILATLLVFGRLVWALAVWTSHVYFLTNQRVVTIKGVFNLSVIQAPLRKIQRTTLYRPFLERLCGLGSIGFATAATTDYDATWIMIARPTAIHEQIVAAIRRVQ